MEKTIKQFIERLGDPIAAKIGEVKPGTAAAYRLGKRVPSPEVAQRYVDTGLIDWEGIYSPIRNGRTKQP